MIGVGTTAGIDNAAGWAFYEAGVTGSPGGGLPAGGTFASNANPSVTFALQPYDVRNALQLSGTAASGNTAVRSR